MSEYKRLTYKNSRGEWCVDKTKDSAIVPVQDGDNRYYVGEPIDQLAKLETDIENGTLIKVPCKAEYGKHLAVTVYVSEDNKVCISNPYDRRTEAKLAELKGEK